MLWLSTKQWLRKPAKSILFFLVLTLGTFLLCLGVQFYRHSVQCADTIDGLFATIAVPDINALYSDSEGFYMDNELYQAAIEAAQSIGIGEKDSREGYYGYAEELMPVLNIDKTLDSPYTYVVLLATFEKHEGEDVKTDDGITYKRKYYFQVEDALAISKAYEIPDRIIAQGAGLEKMEPGKKYLVFGTISSPKQLDKGQGAEYESELSLDAFFGASLGYSEKYAGEKLSSAVKVGESVEEFMASENGKVYRELVENARILLQSAYILSTDQLDSILQFNQKDAYVTKGRAFSEEDHQKGNAVCLISEELAYTNNLSVGDQITLSLHQASYSMLSAGNEKGRLFWWYMRGDVTVINPTEAKTYEIIGLYRTPAWRQETYSLSPNTIIVPDSAVDKRPEVVATIFDRNYRDTPAQMLSFRIPNDQRQAFESALEELGYEKYFRYYDQGYMYVADALQALLANGRYLLIACAAVWLGTAGVYLVFGMISQRKTAGMLLAFGGGKKRTLAYLLLSAILMIGPSVLAGGTAAVIVEKPLFQSISNQTWEENQTNYMYSDLQTSASGTEAAKTYQTQTNAETDSRILYMVGVGSCVVLLIAAGICSVRIAGQKPTVLIKEE